MTRVLEDSYDLLTANRGELRQEVGDAFDAPALWVWFRHQPDEDEPICRYRRDDLVVDLMPTEASAIGFVSRWYAEAVQYRYWPRWDSA